MTAASIETEALLLRSVDYGDADRIVTLLTSRFGKSSYIARGARRSQKRFGGALEPLSLLGIEVSAGRGELGTLRGAQLTRSFPRVLSDLERMSVGFAALELLRELSADHEPDGGVFTTALELLAALDAQGTDAPRLLLCFEVRLLGLVGFAPQLTQCGRCGRRPDEGRAAMFDAHAGHLVCRACGGAAHRLSGHVRGQLALAAGPDWVRAAEPPWSGQELSTARAALRAFVEHRIGHALRAQVLAGGERETA